MNPLRHIRKTILGLNQVEMAALSQVHQSTVSKWENGELHPNRDEMLRIREFARENGLPWEDSWFFEMPEVSTS
jgi:DNA-binding transcriptional regulator YiaG